MSIKTTLVKAGAKALVVSKKYGPTIAFVAGIVATAWSTVEAVKATLKAEDEILYPAKEAFDAIDEKELSDVERKAERRKVYVASAKTALKLYGKALAIWVLGMTCVVGGYKVQSTRLATAVTTVSGLTTALHNYHENTSAVFGKEVADALRTGYNIPEAVDKLNNEKANPENKEKGDAWRDYNFKKAVNNAHDPYVLMYRPENLNPALVDDYWDKDPVVRLERLKAAEDWANRMVLQNRKSDPNRTSYITLNDILPMIGAKTTPEGLTLGWWDDGTSIRPVDFGLSYLLNIMEEHKFDSHSDIAYALDYSIIDSGLDCRRDWILSFNVMGYVTKINDIWTDRV